MSDKLRRCFLILQLFLVQFCYGQNHTEDSLLNRFKRDIQIEQEENNGCVVWDDETRESYYLLISTLSIEVLAKYTSDSIPAVRAAIFSGLTQKSTDERISREILASHVNDTAKFTRRSTDVEVTRTVQEHMQWAMVFTIEGTRHRIDYATLLKEIRNKPRLIISGAYHSTITKDALFKVDSLIYSVKEVKIVSFTLSSETSTASGSNKLTESMKKIVESLKPGEFIYLDEIKAELPDKSTRRLPSIVLKIK